MKPKWGFGKWFSFSIGWFLGSMGVNFPETRRFPFLSYILWAQDSCKVALIWPKVFTLDEFREWEWWRWTQWIILVLVPQCASNQSRPCRALTASPALKNASSWQWRARQGLYAVVNSGVPFSQSRIATHRLLGSWLLGNVMLGSWLLGNVIRGSWLLGSRERQLGTGSFHPNFLSLTRNQGTVSSARTWVASSSTLSMRNKSLLDSRQKKTQPMLASSQL